MINVPVVSRDTPFFQKGRLTHFTRERWRALIAAARAFDIPTQKRREERREKEAFSVAASPARSGGQDNGCEGGDNISLMRLMGKSKATDRVGTVKEKKKNKTSGIKVLSGKKKNFKHPVICYHETEFCFFSCTSWKLLILSEAFGLLWQYRRTGGVRPFGWHF